MANLPGSILTGKPGIAAVNSPTLIVWGRIGKVTSRGGFFVFCNHRPRQLALTVGNLTGSYQTDSSRLQHVAVKPSMPSPPGAHRFASLLSFPHHAVPVGGEGDGAASGGTQA